MLVLTLDRDQALRGTVFHLVTNNMAVGVVLTKRRGDQRPFPSAPYFEVEFHTGDAMYIPIRKNTLSARTLYSENGPLANGSQPFPSSHRG